MKHHFTAPALLLVGTLAACSSSSSPDPFNEFRDTLASVGDEGENTLAISVDDLPDTADLSGTLSVLQEDNEEIVYVGTANATADFGEGTLVGTADNFAEYEVSEGCADGIEGCTGTALQTLDGTADIEGEITGTDFTFTTNGTVTGENILDEGVNTVSVSAEGEGVFRTLDDELVALGAGEGTATATTDDGTSTTNIEAVLILSDK